MNLVDAWGKEERKKETEEKRRRKRNIESRTEIERERILCAFNCFVIYYYFVERSVTDRRSAIYVWYISIYISLDVSILNQLTLIERDAKDAFVRRRERRDTQKERESDKVIDRVTDSY